MNPKPTPDQIFEAWTYQYNELLKQGYGELASITICDFYYEIKKRHRGYKLETFHELQVEMYLNRNDWNGYRVWITPGNLTGVCSLYKRNKITIHPEYGWKFIRMWKPKPLRGA